MEFQNGTTAQIYSNHLLRSTEPQTSVSFEQARVLPVQSYSEMSLCLFFIMIAAAFAESQLDKTLIRQIVNSMFNQKHFGEVYHDQ